MARNLRRLPPPRKNLLGSTAIAFRSHQQISHEFIVQPIPVKPYPIRETFDTFREAIEHAQNHPRQRVADADAALLEGTTLVDAFWSLSESALQFSNEKWLRVCISDESPTWQLLDERPSLAGQPIFRVGAEPLLLDWQGVVGVRPMDISSLIEKRIGARFHNLFVNERSFYVYFRGHLILTFSAAFRPDTGEDVLYVCEEE